MGCVAPGGIRILMLSGNGVGVKENLHRSLVRRHQNGVSRCNVKLDLEDI